MCKLLLKSCFCCGFFYLTGKDKTFGLDFIPLFFT